MNKRYLFIIGALMICTLAVAQHSKTPVGENNLLAMNSSADCKDCDESKLNGTKPLDTPNGRDIAQVKEATKLDVDLKNICKMAIAHNSEMDETFGYGEFTGFETFVMGRYAQIPYKSLEASETRELFSDFWNKYLLGTTPEQLCRQSYKADGSISTGSLLRWLVETGNTKLFIRFVDPGMFSIDVYAVSTNGETLEQWLKYNMKDNHISVSSQEHYAKFYEILKRSLEKRQSRSL